MNNTTSLRTTDAYRLAKAPQWASSYRQDRTSDRTAPDATRSSRTDSSTGVVVPFRQRA